MDITVINWQVCLGWQELILLGVVGLGMVITAATVVTWLWIQDLKQ